MSSIAYGRPQYLGIPPLGQAAHVHSVPSFPWYIGMGWTVGCRHGGWYSSGCSHSIPGTLGYMMGWTADTVSSLQPNGHEQPVLKIQCNGIHKYCWMSVGNAGHLS